MKNILITGGTGYIGSNVLAQLNSKYNFYSLVRNPSPAPFANHIKQIHYNGTYSSIQESLKNIAIDSVLHMATLFKAQHKSEDIPDLMNANLTFGCQILEWMSKNNIKEIINIGTYAQSIDGINEKSQNLYTTTKSAFERFLDFYTESFDFKTINLYFYDTYGPKDTRPKLINLIINALSKNEKLGMSPGDQEICYLFINDVVEAIDHSLQMLSKVESQKIHKYSLYSSEIVTVKELVQIAESTLDKKLNSEFGFYPYRKNEIMKFKARYPILPNWNAKTKISDGIKQILKA